MGALTSRLQTDCQAITRCVATNLNIALRNGLQALGEGVCFIERTCMLAEGNLCDHCVLQAALFICGCLAETCVLLNALTCASLNVCIVNLVLLLLPVAGGFVYLWVLSRDLCIATVAITSILW